LNLPPIPTLKNRTLEFYQKNEVAVSIGVFVFGFVFDLLTLGRIDDLLNLVQQAIYLTILGTLLICEVRVKIGTLTLSGRGQKFWQYHDLVVHFLFGSLLSVFTIFYYTSASAITSFFFILLLAGLMLANEVPQFQKLGLPVRVILYSICVLSYFSFFYPILMGHVGAIPFWLGFLTSVLVLGLIWRLNFKGSSSITVLKRNVLLPAIGIHVFFLLGYYTSLIPPVPVAVKKIGIYYKLEKNDGKYIGSYLRPFWNFWGKGSQDFQTRIGDQLTVILSIFSPGNFEDKVFLKWYFDDEKEGWTLHDNIPMTILGGRDEGFRGFGKKSNYQNGDWRVIVETSDGREVGRINFTIETDESADPREFKQDVF
jgi:hypothetical protein